MFLFVYLSVCLLAKSREIYHTLGMEIQFRIDEGRSEYFNPQILDFELDSLFSFPFFSDWNDYRTSQIFKFSGEFIVLVKAI